MDNNEIIIYTCDTEDVVLVKNPAYKSINSTNVILIVEEKKEENK